MIYVIIFFSLCIIIWHTVFPRRSYDLTKSENSSWREKTYTHQGITYKGHITRAVKDPKVIIRNNWTQYAFENVFHHQITYPICLKSHMILEARSCWNTTRKNHKFDIKSCFVQYLNSISFCLGMFTLKI